MTDSQMLQATAQPMTTPDLPRIRKQQAAPGPMLEVLKRVTDTISPVWPLPDYVAVNPYAGVSTRNFLDARRYLRSFSDCELLMPLQHYAQRFQRDCFRVADIQAAIDELQQHFVPELAELSASDIVKRLNEELNSEPSGTPSQPAAATNDRFRSLSECLDQESGSHWTAVIREEISKYCAAHYDEGQAQWSSPWKALPLYQAWHRTARHDRNVEWLGLKGFRQFVGQLPETPEAAIEFCLRQLGIPVRLWEPMLLCQAFTIPGWSAWTRYQVEAAQRAGRPCTDLAGLLAIRLAYDAALAQRFSFQVDWERMTHPGDADDPLETPTAETQGDIILRYALLRADEIGYRRGLLETLGHGTQPTDRAQDAATTSVASAAVEPVRTLAQMVFCIDVRSERMRRHLESVSPRIETFGFAGFFGVPIEYVPLGETCGSSQVPVLLTPQFQLREGFRADETQSVAQTLRRRATVRLFRKAWKEFQTSAVSCFTFVETSGLLFGAKLLSRTSRLEINSVDTRFDGVAQHDRERLGPTLRGLNRQGLTTSRQADLAESILRNLGLTEGFARLVVFCGHASQTENNPLQAGLDCGACGGHSGEPNARFAAMLLNQPYIRRTLVDRGISIPEDTHFLAAVHNTTTDGIELFDLADIPPSHRDDVRRLSDYTGQATAKTRAERMPLVSSPHVFDLLRRSQDWSEVRPEWGLAGNAAFIAAPRALTASANLAGRAFLHNYDEQHDPDGKTLELIMTAPLVVAHLINMQYYASTVDNEHFGSGSKTIHNVVGRFGIFSGNGGDLMTGLPWESLHDGRDYQHVPQRLLAVIAASREAIERVIEKHAGLKTLLTQGWLHLIAVEGGSFYRYESEASWQELENVLESVC